MEFFYTFLLLIAIWQICVVTRLTVKRFVAISKLKKLDKEKNIKLKFTRSPIKTLFKMSHAPDFIAEIGDNIYLMRFYNGRGKRTQAHFANEEYSVMFSVLLIRSLFSIGARTSSRYTQSTTTVRRKFKYVPKLQVPEDLANAELYGKKIIPVLVFNPAPGDVSYVTDEKTSIKLAFTGDEFRGIKIFTASSLVNFLEREKRYYDDCRMGAPDFQGLY